MYLKLHRYRIEYRSFVLKDSSHQKEYRSSEEIMNAYKYHKSLPSTKSVLYSRIELLPKISKNSSKYRDCCIPCAILCRTSSEIYIYYENDDNYINIHLPVEDDYEIMWFSFKPINKSSITGKQFKIINSPYKMYININNNNRNNERSLIDQCCSYITQYSKSMIFKTIEGEGILNNDEITFQPINNKNTNKFLSITLSFKLDLYYSGKIIEDERLENKCIRISLKMKNKLESVKCPICDYCVGNTEGLYYHNISIHPNYIMRCLYRENKIIIEVNNKHNDNNIKSNFGNISLGFKYIKKSKLTPSLYQRMLTKYEEKTKIIVKSKPMNQMNVDLLMNHNYYHSKDCVPISPSSLLVDSDYEEDDKYITDNWDVIDRLKDLSINEKMFMKIWNSFIYRESPISDSQIPTLCIVFIELFKECLIEKHLLCDAFLHFINLYHFGLMKRDYLEKICHIILESDENGNSVEVLVENVAEKINSLQNLK